MLKDFYLVGAYLLVAATAFYIVVFRERKAATRPLEALVDKVACGNCGKTIKGTKHQHYTQGAVPPWSYWCDKCQASWLPD